MVLSYTLDYFVYLVVVSGESNDVIILKHGHVNLVTLLGDSEIFVFEICFLLFVLCGGLTIINNSTTVDKSGLGCICKFIK